MGLWRVLSDLEEEGYRVETGIFSAEEVGAPHQRKRVFILACLPNTQIEGLEGHSGMLTKQDRRCDFTQNDLSKQELGNSTSLRPHRGRENCEGEQSEVLGERLESDGEEVADSNDNGYCTESRRDGEEEGVPQEHRSEVCGGMPKRTSGQPTELANSASREPRQSQARDGGQDISGGSEETQWPARPGEEQYAWEEPRVTEIVGKLGGTADGTQHRVDRLRLLGNGVVPQTAELAWKTLWQRI